LDATAAPAPADDNEDAAADDDDNDEDCCGGGGIAGGPSIAQDSRGKRRKKPRSTLPNAGERAIYDASAFKEVAPVQLSRAAGTCREASPLDSKNSPTRKTRTPPVEPAPPSKAVRTVVQDSYSHDIGRRT
jgi:hypothetical protein